MRNSEIVNSSEATAHPGYNRVELAKMPAPVLHTDEGEWALIRGGINALTLKTRREQRQRRLQRIQNMPGIIFGGVSLEWVIIGLGFVFVSAIAIALLTGTVHSVHH